MSSRAVGLLMHGRRLRSTAPDGTPARRTICYNIRHGALPARSRNPPAHRAGRADAGAAVHDAVPHRSRARLLHDPRSARPRRRFRHRAGGEPDFRRAGRAVGGVGVAADGRAGERAAGRARARPRHHDARRAARGASGAGVSRRAGRPSDRDQPGAARAPGGDAQGASTCRCCGTTASTRCPTVRSSCSPTSSSTRCRCTRRSSRSTAGTSAWSGSTSRATSPSASPTSRSRCSISCCRRRCATRRSARCSNGARTIWRSRSDAASCARAAPRWSIDYGHVESAAGETLQAVGRHGFADPLGAPGQVDLTAHVDFQALRARRREHGRARARPARAGRIPAPHGHRAPRHRAQGRASRRTRPATSTSRSRA